MQSCKEERWWAGGIADESKGMCWKCNLFCLLVLWYVLLLLCQLVVCTIFAIFFGILKCNMVQFCDICIYIVWVCPKKVVHQTHVDNFVNSQLILKILSLLEKEVNFQQTPYNTSHHTFSMLLHYFAKVRSLSFGISGRKCNGGQWFLNTHPILVHIAYLLACCFNFWFLFKNLCK